MKKTKLQKAEEREREGLHELGATLAKIEIEKRSVSRSDSERAAIKKAATPSQLSYLRALSPAAAAAWESAHPAA